jgi:hypothetical protein
MLLQCFEQCVVMQCVTAGGDVFAKCIGARPTRREMVLPKVTVE